MKVVISGSRSIKSLPAEAIARINKIINLDAIILIGDAPGVDKLVQHYLLSVDYKSVVVCHAYSKPRNNVGSWRCIGGFSSYTARDRYMCDESDYGLAIWDGRSPGTKGNIDRVPTRVILVK